MDSLATRVPEGQEFHLISGRVLKNLYELNNALKSMDEETFSHHVNDERNDFANWIRHVYSDERLAALISLSKDKDQITHHLSQRLSHPKVGELPATPTAESKEQPETDRKEKKKKLEKIAPKEADQDPKLPGGEEDAQAALMKQVKLNGEIEQEMLKRLDEVLAREREIDFRERKIQEIEENIETQLKEVKDQKQTEAKFFSKEFVQGLVAGFLITLILVLIYLKFMF